MLDGAVEVKLAASGYRQAASWFGRQPTRTDIHDHILNVKVVYLENKTCPWSNRDYILKKKRIRTILPTEVGLLVSESKGVMKFINSNAKNK
jgi:hypothetical protein